VQAKAELLEYSINNVTEGIDALGHASVRVRGAGDDGRVNPQRGATQAPILHGHAADSDVIVASTKAYLAALNRVIANVQASERAASRPDASEGPAKAVGSG
jgi:2-isopropylmalate synthase